uniref:C-type lectin domain-containing protein n=1 Tax=Salmo trutta TaxID=8032 RepID=A0A673WIM0_SALTR
MAKILGLHLDIVPLITDSIFNINTAALSPARIHCGEISINILDRGYFGTLDRDRFSYCREKYIDLAFISNQQEVDEVNNISRTDYVWIGLYRDPSHPTEWKWSGGWNSSFKFWGKGQPNNKHGNQDCVSVWKKKMNDDQCTEQYPFLCQTGKWFQSFFPQVNILKKSPCPDIFKMSCQGKHSRNTVITLSVSKIPYRKNEWWKNDWNHLFPCLTTRFYGYYDLYCVTLYLK